MLTLDQIHDMQSEYEHHAALVKNEAVAKATAYYDGYMQACNDLGRRMREMLILEANE